LDFVGKTDLAPDEVDDGDEDSSDDEEIIPSADTVVDLTHAVDVIPPVVVVEEQASSSPTQRQQQPSHHTPIIEQVHPQKNESDNTQLHHQIEDTGEVDEEVVVLGDDLEDILRDLNFVGKSKQTHPTPTTTPEPTPPGSVVTNAQAHKEGEELSVIVEEEEVVDDSIAPAPTSKVADTTSAAKQATNVSEDWKEDIYARVEQLFDELQQTRFQLLKTQQLLEDEIHARKELETWKKTQEMEMDYIKLQLNTEKDIKRKE